MALAWLAGAGAALADVTEVGAFSNHVAVEVPSFHGIEPSVALGYDSTRGNGSVGVGWRLDAASYVARSGRHGGTPRFDATDDFTLDGEQLVACAPNCATGGTHETRRRDFTRITFDGTRWIQWRPNGIKLVYEPLPLANAKGTYRWALASVTDTHGNTVRYHHGCDATECYLESISYGWHPRVCHQEPHDDGPVLVCGTPVAGAEIRFDYETRTDPVSYATGQGVAVTSKRLKTIEVRMADALVRAYALKYEPSGPTGASLLHSTQQFPSDATIDASGTVTAGATAPHPAIT